MDKELLLRYHRTQYWPHYLGPNPTDAFGQPITDQFIVGFCRPPGAKITLATMTPESLSLYSVNHLANYNKRYRKQPDGRWLKIED